jgi:hypothetical protein
VRSKQKADILKSPHALHGARDERVALLSRRCREVCLQNPHDDGAGDEQHHQGNPDHERRHQQREQHRQKEGRDYHDQDEAERPNSRRVDALGALRVYENPRPMLVSRCVAGWDDFRFGARISTLWQWSFVRLLQASWLHARILAFQSPKVNNRRPRQALASGRCDTKAWSDLPKPEMCVCVCRTAQQGQSFRSAPKAIIRWWARPGHADQAAPAPSRNSWLDIDQSGARTYM